MERKELEDFKIIFQNNKYLSKYSIIKCLEDEKVNSLLLKETYDLILYLIKKNKMSLNSEKRKLKFDIYVLKFLNYLLKEGKFTLMMEKQDKLHTNNYEQEFLEKIEKYLDQYNLDTDSISLADLNILVQSFNILHDNRKIIDAQENLIKSSIEKDFDGEIAISNLKNEHEKGIKVLSKHLEKIN